MKTSVDWKAGVGGGARSVLTPKQEGAEKMMSSLALPSGRGMNATASTGFVDDRMTNAMTRFNKSQSTTRLDQRPSTVFSGLSNMTASSKLVP